MVALKKVSKSKHPHEAEITQYLSAETQRTDPQNHCVPICEILQCPDDEDTIILVMPFFKLFDRPRFETVGEAVEFIQQMIEVTSIWYTHMPPPHIV